MAYDAEPIVAPKGEDVHQLALTQFGDICSAQQEERAQALQDRRFVSIAGAQWEGPWQEQFANSIMVEVNKTAQGVEKIIADYRANRMIVNFRAVDKGASSETADTMNGMFRADVYNSKGQQAFDCAFEEAVQGGMGAWRLTNRYVDEYDPDDDRQRICIEIVCDADQSVFWDMNARLYDKSDAMYCFVVTAMAREAYIAEYDDDPASWPEDILKSYYDWYTPDVVRVAEYYRVEETTQVRITLRHSATGEDRREWLKDIGPEALTDLQTQGWLESNRKRVKRRRVVKYVMSANKMLRPRQVIAGDQIPVVPVYGKRWFIDNMERCRGHVRLAKDPQRIYNAQISKLTETAAIAPTERPIFTPEQIAGHEASWASANINRSPYALVNPVIGADGNPLPAGPIGMVQPPQLSPVLGALIQVTASDIAELTQSDSQADEVRSNVSADAMDIAATRTDAKAFTYMDNMRQSMQRCGEIWQAMARDIYIEEGREVETMDEDGGNDTAMLMQPFTDSTGVYRIINDLTAGRFKVISDVTEATSTRRDKTVRSLVNVAQIAQTTDPELASAALATALNNMDGDGMQDLQDWNRKRLVTQGIVKPNDEEKRAMEEAAANQQPDPQAQVLAAQTDALAASAVKDQAMAVKYEADTKLSEAKTVQALADAEKTQVEVRHDKVLGPIDRIMGALKGFGRKAGL